MGYKKRATYFGQMKGGERHGRGTTLYLDKVHEGYYLNGKANGMGRVIFASGRVYTGQAVGGLFEGTGILTDPDGTRYTGQFKKGKKNGYGR